jgi:hypothetical protein
VITMEEETEEEKDNCFGIGDEMILGAVVAAFSAGAMCACNLGRGRKRKRASDVEDLVPPDGEVLNTKV